MITKEHIMNIRSLAKQGYSQRQIAEMTGLNRRTIRRYLEPNTVPVYQKANRTSKLDNFKAIIEGWLSEQNFQASKIYEMLIPEGYQGSYSTVQRYVEQLKERRDRVAYIRFETMPGQQAQVDFADFKVTEIDGSTSTVYVFIMVLGYSRHMYIEFIRDCTMPNFLACHQHAFGFFGGIPAEIVYDNMKNVVIKRLVGRVQWNQEFSSFALHYGFQPIATTPYSPWVKGKVERPIDYVRERFWRGYTYTDVDIANRDIRQWINSVAKERRHGTHHQKVSLRFEGEQAFLSPLPQVVYDISEKVYRKVHKDCTISFDGNVYAVAHEYVGQKVLLRIRGGIIRIMCDDKLLTHYRIPEGKGHFVVHPWIYTRLRADKEQLKRKYQTPDGKAKATRGLIKNSLDVEVMARPLSVYDQEVMP